MFWASVIALTVLTLAVVLSPLFRARRPQPARVIRDAGVYRAQLAEIDQDAAQGLLTPDQAATARIEVERRLLALADRGTAIGPGFGPWPRRAVVAVAVLLVPAGALSTYAMLGAPEYPDLPLAARGQALAEIAETRRVEEMVDRLAARLKEDKTGDVKGWAMLGRSYMVLGRHAEGADALSRAYGLSPADPSIASAYGEALVHTENGVVSERARGLFEDTLEQDPASVTARFYLGLALAQSGEELPRAVEIWTDIERTSPPDAPWLPTLRRQIAVLRDTIRTLKNKAESEESADTPKS